MGKRGGSPSVSLVHAFFSFSAWPRGYDILAAAGLAWSAVAREAEL